MSRKLSVAILVLTVFCVVIVKNYACPPENDPPVAVLDAVPATAGAGVNVILDGSGSYDPDGSIILYYWDWDNDGNVDYHETSSNHPDGAFDGNTPHAYSIPGTYTAKLWVLDDGFPGKNDTDTCTVTIIGVNNTTQETWYVTIQAALDDANDDDVIVVHPDTYYENIDFNGISCTLRSSDPNDFDTIGTTVIDGSAAGTVITCDSNSVLTGFTITNGTYGIDCDDSSPAITKCLIKDNSSAGIYCSGSASPTIKNNWIYDNSKGIEFASSNSTAAVSNNTIVDNTNYGITGADTSPTITNCIIWRNSDDLSTCTATYSCIEDGDAGTGNISNYPYFEDYANNDFHLTLNSQCINRGDPNGSYTGQIDIDGEDRVADEMFVDARIDMGADELHLVAGNMVKNPGFELGGGGLDVKDQTSDDVPLYWHDEWEGVPGKLIDSNESHSDANSWKFENDGDHYCSALSDYIEIDSDNTYIVSAWAKCQTKKERTYCAWAEYDNNQNYLLSAAAFVLYNDLIDTEWTKYSGGYRPRHPDTATVRLALSGPGMGGSSGTVWWDDISLTDIGTQFLPPYGYVNETDVAKSIDFGGAETNIDWTDYSTKMSGKLTDSGDNNITYRNLLANKEMRIQVPEFNVDANDYNCPQTPMLLEIMYRDDVNDKTTGYDTGAKYDNLVVVRSKIDYVDRDPCYIGISEDWDRLIGHLGGYNDNRWKYFQYAFQKTDFTILRAIDANYTIEITNYCDVNLPIDYVSLRKITQTEYEDLANKQRAARGFYEPELPEDAPAEPNYNDPNITVFTRDIMRPVYRYTMPGANEVDANITGFSAWGVVEPVSFSIYSENGVNDLTITVSDLANGGDTISSSEISIYHVIYDETRLNFNEAPRTYALVPDRLEEFTTFSVEPNTSERIWLKINVPDANDGKPAGLYQGNATISRTGQSDVNVPIDFTIYDITLDDPNHINPVWSSPFDGIYSNDMNVTFDAYRETGFDPMCPGGVYRITVSDNNGVPAFDSNNFETAMSRMAVEGHARDKVNLYINEKTWQEIYEIVFETDFIEDYNNLYYDLSDANFVSSFESLLARYEQIADDLNIEFIYHIFDEPSSKKYERLVSDRLFTIIHDYNEPNEPNDLLTGATYYTNCDDDVNVSPRNAPDGNTIPALTNLVDYKYWNLGHEGIGYDRHNDPNDPNYHGHLGYYTTFHSNLRNPVYNRFLHGLFAFGTDARAAYAWTMRSTQNDLYNDLDAGYTFLLPFSYPDFLFAYPTWSGKLHYTIGGLEAIREGIKDARYIATLRNIIDDPNTDPNDQDVIDANDFLDDLHDRIDPNFTNYHTRTTALGYYHRILDEITDPNDPNDPNDFDTFTYIRKTIADHIRDIQP